MRCPFCEHDRDKVVDSRAIESGRSIRRRRECLKCNRRFTTYEHVEDSPRLTVVKKDGSRVPYTRAKIITGLEKACYKRPVSADQLTAIAESVEEELFQRGDKEVPAVQIGQMLAERLRNVDQVAYVRFASVYRQFRNVEDLLDEVKEVIANSAPPPPPEQGNLF